MDQRSVYVQQLRQELDEHGATLVAVSKMQPIERIRQLFALGQRHFGENYVQELLHKAAALPAEVQWHFIGHLQTNKVKFILPYISLVHGVDSLRLLKEIDKQSRKLGKITDCLLQVFIADEETKFGFDVQEVDRLLEGTEVAGLANVRVRGLMGMASFSDDQQKVREEFGSLKSLFDRHLGIFRSAGEPVLSMGMSGDYKLALEEGSNMVRIGSLLFGSRPAK